MKLTLPITLGLGSSFIIVFVDLAMVGKLGTAAVAALGLSIFCYSLFTAFLMGLIPAVQGIVARRRGGSGEESVSLPLNAGLVLALIIGVPLTILGYVITPQLFSLISSDPEVNKEGIPYLRALYLTLVGVGLNNAFTGFWNGLARTRVYMFNFVFVTCLHIALNYVLIFGKFGAPALGVAGAGIASALSVYAGTLIYFLVTWLYFWKHGFLRIRPERSLIRLLFNLGLPNCLREAFFALGYVVFFWMIGLAGTAELAAANVIVRTTLVLLLFANALAMASATLVSNTLGKGDLVGATEWGWDSTKLGIIWFALLGLPLLIFPEQYLALFLSDPHTIAIAIIPLQMTSVLTALASLVYVLGYTLISLGDGKRVLIASLVTQWIFFLPAVWVVGPYMNYGLLGIWLVQLVYCVLGAAIITTLWTDGRWKRIEI